MREEIRLLIPIVGSRLFLFPFDVRGAILQVHLGPVIRPVSLFTLIAFLLPALACAEYPGVPRQISGAASAGSVSLPPAAGSVAGSDSDAGDGQIAFGREVQIELRDFELFPGDLTVPSGEITFTLANRGRYTHDFRVEGDGVDEKSPRVSAGRTGVWSLTLPPGVYRLSCPISNHADRGMVGTLTVTPND